MSLGSRVGRGVQLELDSRGSILASRLDTGIGLVDTGNGLVDTGNGLVDTSNGP